MSDELPMKVNASRDAWYIRFYLWLYEASPNRINTCKLFWAFVFALPVLLIRVLLGLAVAVYDRVPKRSKSKVEAYDINEPENDDPSRIELKLEAVSNKLSAFWARFQTPITWIFFGFCAGFLALCAVYIIIAIIQNLVAALIGIGIGVAAIVLFAILLALAERKGPGFKRNAKAVFNSVHNHTCAEVKLSD